MFFADVTKTVTKLNAPLTFMVSKESDSLLRVVILPPTPEKGRDNDALNRPLLIVQPPEKLDAELGGQLAGYFESRQQLVEELNSLEAANKALQAETTKTRTKVRETQDKTKAAAARRIEEEQAKAKASRTGEDPASLKQAAEHPQTTLPLAAETNPQPAEAK